MAKLVRRLNAYLVDKIITNNWNYFDTNVTAVIANVTDFYDVSANFEWS